MAYTTTTDVRLLTNLTTNDVSDADLTSIIDKVTAIINSKINVRVTRELVTYVDAVRTNYLNNSNTTFYVQNWKGKFLADVDNDANVTTSDITVYKVDTNEVETQLTVSSVTYDEGKFVLSTAPTGTDKLYITYQWTRLDPVTPDPLINMAATYLAAYYAFIKKETGTSEVIRFGNMMLQKKIIRNTPLGSGSATYLQMYQSALRDIYSIISTKGDWINSSVRI